MIGGPKLQALSVLVVDDNKFMRSVVENLCRGLGIGEFAQAETVEQALEVLARKSIDLVVTDWHMEATDGLTFVKYLRNDPDSPTPMCRSSCWQGTATASVCARRAMRA